MLIERINNNNPNKELINRSVKILKSGGIIVIPTETAYGLAADATNAKAVKKIYKIKGRSFNKFLPLIASSVNQVKKYFRLNKQELELFKKYKGLSIIIKPESVGAIHELPLHGKSNSVYLLKNQADCAVRISPNQICKLLTQKLGRLITATSANLAGQPTCYSVTDILKQFKNNITKPDLILDAGQLNKKRPSTIVKVIDNKVKILRQGEIELSGNI